MRSAHGHKSESKQLTLLLNSQRWVLPFYPLLVQRTSRELLYEIRQGKRCARYSLHVLTWEGLHVRAVWGGKEKANSKLNAGSKFKAAAKKSSDDDRNTGESKKESAKKIVKQIGKGLKGLLK